MTTRPEVSSHDLPRAKRAIATALASGNHAAAIAAAQDWSAAAPGDFRPLGIMADLLAQSGDFGGALAKLDLAERLGPDEPSLAMMVIEFALQVSQRQRAIERAGRLEVAALTPEQADRVGTLLTHAGALSQALPFFLHALADRPDDPGLLFNVAATLQMIGQSDLAERHLNRVVALNPTDGQAHLLLSSLRRQTKSRNHIDLLTHLVKQASGLSGTAMRFALAKELEDVGRHSEAATHLQLANRLVRESMDYSVEADIDVLEQLGYDALDHGGADDSLGNNLLFIIGLPRSGTTLVERVLASHGAVDAGGETGLFAQLAVRATKLVSAGATVPRGEFLSAVKHVDTRALGQSYLEQACPQLPAGRVFTDKTPDNYLYVGLIAAALPKARFLLVERCPLDVGFALFKTLFNQAYPFTYDLDDVGKYIVAWQSLMDRWKAMLGPALLTVRYEDLVFKQEHMSRAIIKHAGLSWNPAVLDFHKLATPVTTASSAQVRLPIYASSIGRWKEYSELLNPLVSRLQKASPTVSTP